MVTILTGSIQNESIGITKTTLVTTLRVNGIQNKSLRIGKSKSGVFGMTVIIVSCVEHETARVLKSAIIEIYWIFISSPLACIQVKTIGITKTRMIGICLSMQKFIHIHRKKKPDQ